MPSLFGPPRPDRMPSRQQAGPPVITVRHLVPVLLVDLAFVPVLAWILLGGRGEQDIGLGRLTLLPAALLAFALASLVVIHFTVIRRLQRAKQDRSAVVWERP